MVQLVTEGGWSMVAHDHCWRNPQYYAYIMLYFCLMHLTVKYIIATLIQGIYWEVYFTVNKVLDERDKIASEEATKDEEN